VRAALEVFGERGLAGARLDDIAKRAGLSKGTIYLYFPNKEELFREVVRTVIGEQLEHARTLNHDGSAREELDRYLRNYWEFVRSSDYQAISRMVHGELQQFPDLAAFYGKEVIRPGNEILGAVIRRGIETGEFREVDPLLAARALSAMVITHATWCGKRQLFQILTDVSDDVIFEHMLDFALHAIVAHPADASAAKKPTPRRPRAPRVS
jgi:AcrR family transcriptional regulator